MGTAEVGGVRFAFTEAHGAPSDSCTVWGGVTREWSNALGIPAMSGCGVVWFGVEMERMGWREVEGGWMGAVVLGWRVWGGARAPNKYGGC